MRVMHCSFCMVLLTFGLWLPASPVTAFSQELLKPGPFGRPILVMDEAGNWSIPISVYSDSDLELFVPDITSPGWVQWQARQFRQKGTYVVSIFSFYKNDHLCRRERIHAGHKTDPKWLEPCAALRYQRKLALIDTRANTATFQQVILMERDARYNPLNQSNGKPTVIPLAKVVPRQAYDRISAIVSREMSEYKGMTVEDAIRQDSIVQMGSMMEVMCHATSEQAQTYINAALRGDPNADQMYKAACR